ncbi:hypothetical protein Cyast_1816 [Cyanobacterium stanieri PCC 7202]|uniref:PEP-CTERM/exosortase system-associated acyltransferase n=1 Tax=Cyanobacterium stanieri (strain ATCC 29140 / PCC 7202) TaxID=292563 RepID=K9YMT1_CYASC|nr:hypothetical protein Cyast_1816 [Cyanobacterium stanieri PCC 7202]
MKLKSSENIIDYNNLFDICIANTDELQKESFHLRYRIYCQELNYEPLSKFPDKMEKDSYDSHSIHCLLRYNLTDTYIAGFRLILSPSNNYNKKFPIEGFFPDALANFQSVPRVKFAEVSRLMILPEFRNWSISNNINCDQKDLVNYSFPTSFPLVTLHLYLSFIALLVEFDLDYGLALMQPKLARHSAIIGITSHSIGESIQFNGLRRPFIFKTTEILRNFEQKPTIDESFKKIQYKIRKNLFSNYYAA